MRLLRSGLLALLSAACSTTPGITVQATPASIAGDGVSTITVTAKPTEGGGPVDATVHFSFEVSGVSDSRTYAAWDGATGDPTKLDVQSSNGVATATLKAPRQGWGTVTFTVSFSDQGKEPSASAVVNLTPAGGNAASLTFVCQHQNIGGLVHGRLADIHVLCRATAVDPVGHNIPNASVQTLSEAGHLDWLDDENGVQEFVYTVHPDDPPPKDVLPCDSTSTGHCKEVDACSSACNADPFSSGCVGEPCWVDNAGTHNPRDGIATLIAAVPAQTGFDNYGEPFVDMNDNGIRDPGEPYIDYNGNGKYDAPSGAQQPHMVWKEFRMVWSGEAAVTVAGASGTTHDVRLSATKPDATHATLHLQLFDRNLNQLAADGPSATDGIGWTGTCTNGSVTFDSDDQPMEQRQTHPGVRFDEDLSSATVGSISTPGLRSTWTEDTDYTNSMTFSGNPGDTCSATAVPHRAYDSGAKAIDPGDGNSNPDVGAKVSVSF
jgi:hypothetical protein